MTMSEGLVDGVTVRDGLPVLAIRLPWYRSLPLACLEAVDVSIAGITFAVRSVAVDGFTGPIAAAAASDAVWDLRDLLEVTLDGRMPAGARIEVGVAIRIPYIQQAPGVPLVQRAVVRTEASIR